MGRTGRYFAYQKFSSMPDVVLVAKPLAAGLPLGAVLTSETVAQRISPGLHGTTFGGGPLACATALEFLNIVEDEKLLENIRARGAELREGLSALAAKFPFVREIRGEGLMIGIELSIDGAPFVSQACSTRPAHQLHARFHAAFSPVLPRHARAGTPVSASPGKTLCNYPAEGRHFGAREIRAAVAGCPRRGKVNK